MIVKTTPNQIFPNQNLPQIPNWEFFILSSTFEFNIHQFVHEKFTSSDLLVMIIYNQSQEQYLLFIKEIGVYNLLFKSELSLGQVDYASWSNYIYEEGGIYWNDKAYKGSHLDSSFVIIRSNPNLLFRVLFDLYELLSNPLIHSLLLRIDDLLLENDQLQANLENSAKLLKERLDQNYIDGGQPCLETP